MKALEILILLCLTTCTNDSGPSEPGADDCEGENVFGPADGMIEITDTNSVFYGLPVVIPAVTLKNDVPFISMKVLPPVSPPEVLRIRIQCPV